MKMKIHNFVLLGMAFATMAVYGEPINLGCNARGPLAALDSSVAFREAIGAANPANFLASVYDVNGQQLSPASSKALQCPLFIDSNAVASASSSRAILSAEASVRSEKPKQQAAAPVAVPVENETILILSAAGVVAQIPQPEIRNPEPQEKPLAKSLAKHHAKPHAALRAEAGKTQNGRVVTTASVLGFENELLQSGASKLGQELKALAPALPAPKQIEAAKAQSVSAVQYQQSAFLSLAQALRLIKQVQIRGSQSALEFDPLMVLLDFFALFAAILAFCLLVFYPGLATAVVQNSTDRYRTALTRIDPDSVIDLSGWRSPHSNAATDPSHAQTSASKPEIPAQVA
jgi:hypothetical protein